MTDRYSRRRENPYFNNRIIFVCQVAQNQPEVFWRTCKYIKNNKKTQKMCVVYCPYSFEYVKPYLNKLSVIINYFDRE